MSECLFWAIIAGEIPAEVVLDTDAALVFRDIDPKAPTHVLVIPKVHVANIGELAASDPAMVGAMVDAARQAAELDGISQYRLVFNTGADAGQSVFHAHGHLLAGRPLSWPPG